MSLLVRKEKKERRVERRRRVKWRERGERGVKEQEEDGE